MTALVLFLLVIVVVVIGYGIRIINQYERGVVFRLGKVQGGVKEPGMRLIIPVVDKLRKVTLRTVTLPIEGQKIITRDNVSIDVSAVAYYKVNDPIKAIVEIEDVVAATYQIAQTTVRNVVGQSTLDVVLSETTAINDKIKIILDNATEQWGVSVSTLSS
jgi:regulator of protease activity HflC (stomatin/prohibitin superfamily)